MSEYTADPTPGDWDHRSGDCEAHGANVVFFRQKGASGPYYCVQCALTVLNKEVALVVHEDTEADLDDWYKEQGA